MNSKCLPTLLYGFEACPLKSADLKSLDYIVVGVFMNIFKTKSKEVASCCLGIFNLGFGVSLFLLTIEDVNFCKKNTASENIICRHCADCVVFLLFYMCHLAIGLTRCYKRTVFLHLLR